jgi:methylthioribulose-1-phosphate dehydratase
MTSPEPAVARPGDFPQAAGLIECGAMFHARGWSLATSSNYSSVLSRSPTRLLLTASGKHKERLTPADFVVVDAAGAMVPTSESKAAPGAKPSAETLLHTVVVERRPTVGAVLHTHSVHATLLSDLYSPARAVPIRGFEMIKGLAGVTTHETELRVPVFENTQHIPDLAEEVGRWLDAEPNGAPAFLIRRHGLYTWGRDIDEARRHIETLEFLFEIITLGLKIGRLPSGITPLPGG